jgi:hypothetical protein
MNQIFGSRIEKLSALKHNKPGEKIRRGDREKSSVITGKTSKGLNKEYTDFAEGG